MDYFVDAIPLFMKFFIIIQFAQITWKKELWFLQQDNIAQNFYLLIFQVYLEIFMSEVIGQDT